MPKLMAQRTVLDPCPTSLKRVQNNSKAFQQEREASSAPKRKRLHSASLAAAALAARKLTRLSHLQLLLGLTGFTRNLRAL